MKYTVAIYANGELQIGEKYTPEDIAKIVEFATGLAIKAIKEGR